MSREAMQLALEALEKVITAFGSGLTLQQNAITALRQALVDADDTSQKRVDEKAKREYEPVAWRTFDGEGGYDYRSYEMNENYDKEWAERNPNHAHWAEPLYTSPQKQWVGLTDEEIQDLAYLSQKIDEGNAEWFDRLGFAKAIEQVLKDKNA
jgi:hypothetical protein